MIGRKILTVVGLGTIAGALYTKHVYNQLKTDIMYKLYNGEELDEQEKQFMEKSSEIRQAYKELKEASNTVVEKTHKQAQQMAEQAEETFRQQQQVVEQVDTQM